MSQPSQPAPAPSVSWRRRALRRAAGSLGAAVVLAGVGPAVANAAGADVGNPVAFALRASGKSLASAFSSEGEEAVADPCATPSASPSDAPSVEPSVEPTVDVPAEPSVEPSAEPDATASADPDATASSEPSVEPSADVSEAPSVDPSAEPSVEPSLEASVEPTAAPEDCAEATPAASGSPEAEAADADGEHGAIVSTVAQCSPKGKDPLLDVAGAPANHGGYVKAAAHGDTLTTPWGGFDLSTQAGADALCASFAAARDALPEETAATAKQHGKKDKAAKVRPAKPEKDKSHGKHADGGEADAGSDSGDDGDSAS